MRLHAPLEERVSGLVENATRAPLCRQMFFCDVVHFCGPTVILIQIVFANRFLLAGNIVLATSRCKSMLTVQGL